MNIYSPEKHNQELILKEISTPSDATSGFPKLYFKADGKLYKKIQAIESILETTIPDTVEPTHHNGLVTPTDWSLAYNESTRVLTITISQDTYFYAGNNKILKAANTYVTSAHDDVTDMYYYYFDSDGALNLSNTFPDITQNAILTYIYYNATNNKGVWFDEKHPNTWNSYIHLYEHLYRGSVLKSGGTISGYTLNTHGDTNTSFQIAATVIDDESRRHNLTALTSQPYTIWYRSGSDVNNEWSWNIASTLPYLHDGDDPYYNQLSAGTWVNTAIATNSRWFNMYLCAVNAYNDSGDNWKHRFILIMGQQVYATLAAAQAENFLTGISFGLLPFQEIVPLYQLTYQRSSNATEKNVVLSAVSRIIGTNVTSISAISPTTHNALAGRSDEATHPASSITVDSSTFNNNLSIDDDTVQKVCAKIDQLSTSSIGLIIALSS